MSTKRFQTFKNIELPSDKSSKYGDVDGLSLQNLFYARTGCFPSCYLFDYDARTNGDYTFNTREMAKYMAENIDQDENVEISTYFTKVLGNKEDKVELGFCIILNKSHIYARFEKRVNESYILYRNSDVEALNKFLDMVLQFYTAPNEDTNAFWKICLSQSGYYLDKGHSKCPDNFDVDKLYNDTFKPEDEKIREFIKKDDESGLILLHGEKGTGKSSYIKYLINQFPEKKFVYVPSNLVNMLGDPSFGSFLNTLNNHIIVLEDCENVIMDRKQTQYASAVSLLLNLTDGILSDDLGLKFICTFNDNMKNIDEALLRKGRCISKYEFLPLSIDKSEALLKTRGIEAKVERALTLADIFHYEDDDYQIRRKNII